MDTNVFTLYEFEGDAATGELSFAPGETIIVTNKNVDEGWWEGKKADGTVGLFPQAYVEEQSDGNQAQGDLGQVSSTKPTDPFGQFGSSQSSDPFGQLGNNQSNNAFGQLETNQSNDPFAQLGSNQASDPFGQMTAEFASSPSEDPFGNIDPFQQTASTTNGKDVFDGLSPPSVSPQMSDPVSFSGVFDAPQSQVDQEDDYIDIAVDDWSESSTPAAMSPSSPAPMAAPTQTTTAPIPSPRSASVSSTDAAPSNTSSIKRTGTLRSSSIAKNILSSFTKTTGTAYVMGEAIKANLSGAKKCRIVLSADGPMWENSPKIFSCTISNPTKESKFYKIKNFIAYEVKASFSKRSVPRRYKHFDWLYEQLARKFGATISIPPLPDKQITGRYEDDFVEARRAQLETWLGRMGLHPIVAQSTVLQHFLTPHRQEKDWKAGKRKAEKDDIVGGEFLNTVDVPPQHLDLHMAEQTFETHLKFTRSMDDACKQLSALGLEQVKRHTVSNARESEKLGQAFKLLSEAFSLDDREVALPLTNALKHTGQCFEAIGELYSEQPQCDWSPFLTGLNEYKAVLSTFPGILANQRSAMDKNKEIRRLQNEGKVSFDEMRNAANRTEKLAYAVQAEVNHFQHYRVGDFAGYIKEFLEQQMAFHQEVMRKLGEAAADYKNMVE